MISPRQELYALSGMLPETWTMNDVKPLENGAAGGSLTKMTMIGPRQEGVGHEARVQAIESCVPLEKGTFSWCWFERR
jgi:hypothetical protein